MRAFSDWFYALAIIFAIWAGDEPDAFACYIIAIAMTVMALAFELIDGRREG